MRSHDQSPIERRVEVRLISCISARIWALGTPAPAYTKDISASGIKIQVESFCRFKVGEQYRMEIDLPAEEQTIRTRARIIRIDREPATSSEKWQMALHFVGIHPEDQALIRKFVYKKQIERQRLGLA